MRNTTPTAIREKELAMSTAWGRKIVAGWASNASAWVEPTLSGLPSMEPAAAGPLSGCRNLQ
jgi:hypothetical protein